MKNMRFIIVANMTILFILLLASCDGAGAEPIKAPASAQAGDLVICRTAGF